MTARCVLVAGVLITVVVLLLTSCRSFSGFLHEDPHLAAVWDAWKGGDFARAQREAEALLDSGETVQAGNFMLALVHHANGAHQCAIEHYELVDLNYGWYQVLTEPMLWSYVFAGHYDRAVDHAHRHRLGQVTIDRIRLAEKHPLTVWFDGTVELPFTSDQLSAYMPGIAGSLNGREVVVRLDTGGSYLHVSEESAERFGIKTIGCDRGFASLSHTRICYGVADLEFGSVTMENVPVAVHEQGLSAAALAEHFGAQMDAIIGTNILEQFLATVDGPNNRLILSRRNVDSAIAEHRLLVGENGTEVPFGVWTDHLMIARGHIANHGPVSLFVDSGLVMVTPEQGQASLLISRSRLDSLGVLLGTEGPFTRVMGDSGLGDALRDDLLVYPVADRTWNGFGDWGGVDVAALVGWGYLKRYSWTLDFDRRVFVLRAAESRQ